MSLDPAQSSAHQSRDHKPAGGTPAPVVNAAPTSAVTDDSFSALHSPGTTRLQAKTDISTFKATLADLRSVGVSPWRIGLETTRGVFSEALRWTSQLALIGLALQAVVEHQTPLAIAYIGVWFVCSSVASWAERTWRTRINEFDRAYGRALRARLLNTIGRSTLAQLDDRERQGELELHHERISTLSNLVETSVAFPSYVFRFVLSGSALMAVDWRIGFALTVAVLPGFWMRTKHTKEDLDIELKQSPRAKVADVIAEEAAQPNGSVRMILQRSTDRVVRSVSNVFALIHAERNSHERRQAFRETLSDGCFYASLGTAMALLLSQHQSGAIGIGVLGFLWRQLLEIAHDLDGQSEQVQEYVQAALKTKEFYAFTSPGRTSERETRNFPLDYTLSFTQMKVSRGEEDSRFTVSVPDFQLTPGSLLLIHGASGAGKTTLQRHLAFAASPESGAFLVGGIPADLIHRDQWFASIAYCGAAAALLRSFTIREALTLDSGGEEHLEARLQHPLIKDLIEQLSSGHGLDTRIGMGLTKSRDFSTGELQRLMLVTALVPRRKILFLDEVTANQNSEFIATVAAELEQQRRLGTTVIFVTHSQQFDKQASHILRVSRGVATLEKSADITDSVVLKLTTDLTAPTGDAAAG